MESPQQHDHLYRLSTELKCSVARYTPSLADRKALSPVNKAPSSRRDVLGLAPPRSNIVKHVRKIHILSWSVYTNRRDHHAMLLTAIPRNQLREQSFLRHGED
ncbi:uncharacterized protein K460DRAFT_365599 [Cucurbitaria berberidis CBS 394.84]|uniref:Uncharacterized protein n=1 Tax=Cucurbitaria berberidis CBS 394.84 TaxID=1168544 RepID=A0A9P4GFZ6_9PLEO|nr:uncharacterized protein K460DRAFT_365599 [Cucurbitaria berberidis CBS 394.84]KAF1844662.1 hypothetical protein K460DRAFT_365599 [Cucurbitaria berberidis CBS 394.84]